MAGLKELRTEAIPQHRILREVLRHFTEFKEYVTKTGNAVIEHGYLVYDDDGEVVSQEMITISYWDLYDCLKALSDRKREAVFYNVIMDEKQKDVAERMGITTVSVGQYVEQAVLQLAETYFADGNNHAET